MEQYIVSARKYRPATFASVVGQKALTDTLKNAIARKQLAHAYLFCGSRGVGKTSCARIFAKTINCEHPGPDGEACNECDSCRQFNENRSLNIIELDAASNNSVDDIRELIPQVLVPPTQGRYRVFIIDEVHMLSSAAFNAFLKTLEEPPAHAIFILATTEKHKIIPTILSRCQIYDFNRITIRDMVEHLAMVASQEGATAEPAALKVIAKKADGAMRDALSIFDQVLASTRGNITYEATIEALNMLDNSYYERLVDAFVEKDVPKALLIYKEVRDKGFDSLFFINGLAQYFRDLMVASSPSTIVLLDAAEEDCVAMAERARKLTPAYLYKAMDICNDADYCFRSASNKQLLIELTLIKLCQRLSPSTKRSGHVEGRLQPFEDVISVSGGAPTQKVSAPSPSTTTTATAPPPRRRGMAPSSILASTSRSGGAPATPSRDSAPSPAAQNASKDIAGNNPYTDEQFHEAWVEFIAQNATAHILTNSMRVVTPERLDGDQWLAKANGDTGYRAIMEALPQLEGYFRRKLGNSAISLKVEAGSGEASPSSWTDSQILSYWLENSPEVREFIDKYKLRLI